MKKIVLLISIAFGAFQLSAQETKKDTLQKPAILVSDSGKFIVNGQVHYAEIQPQFPGGTDAMNAFLSKNLRYPEEARETNKQGTVYARFAITANGEIDSISIVKSPCTCFNGEVFRVIRKMPPWKPGFKDGKPVRSEYTLPINFKLQ